jgi:hypothetical protein
MNELHGSRRKQELSAEICATRSGNTGRGPKRHAKISLPGFPAELAPPDLERLLPPKILRLFVSQDFLGISFRLDDP